MTLSRRNVVLGLSTLPFANAARASGEPAGGPGLKQRARRRGFSFGAAVQSAHLQKDEALRAALRADCELLVPEWELKWTAIEKERGRRSYHDAQPILDFARRNEMRVRGHTIVWGRSTPPWAEAVLAAPDGKEAFDANVTSFVTHFRNASLDSIDVVNEAVEPNDDRADSLRNTIFLRSQGPSYIADAFFMAREADPGARLYYNDYGVDYSDRYSRRRREGILELLRGLKQEKAPIQGVGIQGHLRAWEIFDPGSFRTFLADIASLDLEIAITEFDVNDQRVWGDVADRDAAVAAHGRAYLETALDERAVKAVLAWSLTDRYSWLNRTRSKARWDGKPLRGHPLDEEMQRKPLWHAMAAAFDAAPQRGG